MIVITVFIKLANNRKLKHNTACILLCINILVSFSADLFCYDPWWYYHLKILKLIIFSPKCLVTLKNFNYITILFMLGITGILFQDFIRFFYLVCKVTDKVSMHLPSRFCMTSWAAALWATAYYWLNQVVMSFVINNLRKREEIMKLQMCPGAQLLTHVIKHSLHSMKQLWG